jgi:hypothetical protein
VRTRLARMMYHGDNVKEMEGFAAGFTEQHSILMRASSCIASLNFKDCLFHSVPVNAHLQLASWPFSRGCTKVQVPRFAVNTV